MKHFSFLTKKGASLKTKCLILQKLKSELNKKQFQTVTQIDGPLLIIAGAGSGKTRTITYRMAYMLDQGIHQASILALTFTNKAAREMQERVKKITKKKTFKPDSIYLSCFRCKNAQRLN